jgi:hypothetical protein
MQKTMPEPAGDIAAQIAAVADPKSPKDAAFVVRGQSMPKIPAHLSVVPRAEGTLITSNPFKAGVFRGAPTLHDGLMSFVLGYPETKAQAGAAGAPVMVQSVTPRGAVAHESAASLPGLAAAIERARQIAPSGNVRVMTPAQSLQRRAVGLLGG